MTYRITIRKQTLKADTLKEVSEFYSRIRDESGEGGSTFPEGRVYTGREQVARVSYNGRVWAPGEWKQGDTPLYDNRDAV